MIYFDNAATKLPKPPEVVRAVTEALRTVGNAGRGGYDASMDASRIIFETRQNLAQLFHAENAGRIAFTANSTESLNIAVKGILNPGDHVITTAMEHNSVLRPLYEMEERGVEVTIIPADRFGRIDYDDFRKNMKRNTKAVVCTHASNLTGNLIDVKRIGRTTRDLGIIFVVDASQTAGVFDIDVQDMMIDILCFTGHKGLLGPQGTGGIYVREGITVRPLLSGGSGVQTYSKKHPQQMPTALEAGTLNAHGLAGLRAAVEYLQREKIDAIRRKELELMWYFYYNVKEIQGIEIYGDFSNEERCAIVSLNLWDYDSAQVSDVLFQEYKIATRPGAHCAPLMHQALGTVEQGAVRFSFSHYNTKTEVDAAVYALKELARLQEE